MSVVLPREDLANQWLSLSCANETTTMSLAKPEANRMAWCLNLAPRGMGTGLLLASTTPLCDRSLEQKHCVHNLCSVLTVSTGQNSCFLKDEINTIGRFLGRGAHKQDWDRPPLFILPTHSLDLWSSFSSRIVIWKSYFFLLVLPSVHTPSLLLNIVTSVSEIFLWFH